MCACVCLCVASLGYPCPSHYQHHRSLPQAAAIAKNELHGKVADADGVLQPVADEGGRYQMRNIVLDMQNIAKDLGREGAVKVEKAAIGAAACRLVSPTALAVPINEPLSAYDPRTYPISSVHWWFGDGAPNLRREACFSKKWQGCFWSERSWNINFPETNSRTKLEVLVASLTQKSSPCWEILVVDLRCSKVFARPWNAKASG